MQIKSSKHRANCLCMYSFLLLVMVESGNLKVATQIHDQYVSGPESVCADASIRFSQTLAQLLTSGQLMRRQLVSCLWTNPAVKDDLRIVPIPVERPMLLWKVGDAHACAQTPLSRNPQWFLLLRRSFGQRLSLSDAF